MTSSQDTAFQLGEADVLVTFMATSSMNRQWCQFPRAAAGSSHQVGLWGNPPADWLQLRDHTASSISSLGQVCQQSGQLISEGCPGSSKSLRCTDWHISGCRGCIFLADLYFDSTFKQFWSPSQGFPHLSAHGPSLMALQIGSPISFNIQTACDQKSSRK